MEIYHVDPRTIMLNYSPSERDIKRQMARLETEGQIEPILLLAPTGPADLDNWAFADAQIVAAHRLAWPTILVTY